MEKKLVNYLLDLVNIDSITGNEKEIADYTEKFLKNYFPESNIIRLNNSLIAFDDIDPNKKTIGFVGHLDTVPADNKYTGQIIDGKLYGLGASDMKGGLAVMMGLIDYFNNKNKKFNHIYIFYEKEEGPYIDNGLEPLLANNIDLLKNIDLAFVLEPTNNKIQVGAVGTINANVIFKGKKAHSARPWQGENAIYKSIDFLKRISDFGIKEHKFENLSYYEVMNVTTAKTENAHNVIPDKFEMNINYRFPPNMSLEEAQKEILKIVNNEADVDFVDLSPAGTVCLDNPILREFEKRFNLPLEAKQAWTDVARLSQYGIDAVNFGPGDPAQAHQSNEYIPLENLYKNFNYLKEFCEN
jgi:succinyl-diaminopimelate desuccinylase